MSERGLPRIKMNEASKSTAFCLHCGRLFSKKPTAHDHECKGCGASWGWREPMDRDTLMFKLRAAGSLINGDVNFAMRRAIGALINYVDDPEVSRAFLAIMCGQSPEPKRQPPARELLVELDGEGK